MQKERESNFELLRILAMVLIITYHYCLHGNGGTIFSGEICGNQIISVLFGSWGIVGVFLFVFISAYFLIDSKHYKIEKVILIALSTSFYAVLILCIMKMSKTADFELKYILKSFLCPLTDQYWFIPSYIMLFLFYPFLNKFIKSVSRTTLLYLVLLLTMTIPLYRSIIKVAPVHLFSLFIYLGLKKQAIIYLSLFINGISKRVIE
ncbi:MAG: acyltransferase family protein [bacterium]|nr:acyltransferase family protein [bacterium]